MTKTKLKTTRSHLLSFLVNGEEVPKGEKIILFGGQKNDVRVQDLSGELTELRMGLAHTEVPMESLPDFENRVVPIDSIFGWSVSPEDTEGGGANIVFYSSDKPETVEIDCDLKPDISFRFVAPNGQTLPRPPEKFDIFTNNIWPPFARLMLRGRPIEEAKVRFFVEDHEPSEGVTNYLGMATGAPFRLIPLVNVHSVQKPSFRQEEYQPH